MRFQFAVFALLLASLPAFAASDVLLPPTSGAGSSPNLGFAPVTPPTEAAPATIVPAAPPAAPSAPAADSNSAGKTNTTNAASPFAPADLLPYTPGPQTPPPPMPGGMPGLDTPTTILKVPDIAALQGSLPHYPRVLNIQFSDKSVWGPGDTGSVNNLLGIPQNQVAAACRMALLGVIQTSKLPALFSTADSPTVTATYDGTVSDVMLNVQALCRTNSLPPNKGYIQQMGDFYIAPLNTLPCKPPQGLTAPQQLTVLYAGNGAGQCLYR
jgi:hypothetical protein